jgi:hypothetical protein
MTLLAAMVAWRSKFLGNKQTVQVDEIYDEQLY